MLLPGCVLKKVCAIPLPASLWTSARITLSLGTSFAWFADFSFRERPSGSAALERKSRWRSVWLASAALQRKLRLRSMRCIRALKDAYEHVPGWCKDDARMVPGCMDRRCRLADRRLCCPPQPSKLTSHKSPTSRHSATRAIVRFADPHCPRVADLNR